MFEVEQKFHVSDTNETRRLLEDLKAVAGPVEVHADTYYNHPCKDFAESKEAFRVRRINGRPLITYKGPKLPGTVKARQELEWSLDPGDQDGTKMEQLLQLLGFRRVATVEKNRRPFSLPGPLSEMTVVLDEVEKLGFFAEIEILAGDQEELESARAKVLELASRLGLRDAEPKSYLTMLLETGID